MMGVNGAWFLSDTLRFSFYTIVDMEFYDKQPDIIRSVIGQPDLVLFTTMHGSPKSTIAIRPICAPPGAD